jgi:hypothetical protein
MLEKARKERGVGWVGNMALPIPYFSLLKLISDFWLLEL